GVCGGGGPNVCGCGADQANCNGRCVDPSSDPANCGACGVHCGMNTTCVKGACVCAPGFMSCKDSCVDVTLDPANCGDCGQPCPGAPSTAICNRGVCGCAMGWGDCDRDPSNGCETYVYGDDPANCGACAKVCSMGDSCHKGACVSNGGCNGLLSCKT